MIGARGCGLISLVNLWISVSAQLGYTYNGYDLDSGARGTGGFGGSFAPVTTAAPASTWDEVVWRVTDSWEEVDDVSGETMTGFKALVTIPVIETTNGQWQLVLHFSKPVADLTMWTVIIVDWSQNLTDYAIINQEHNGFLQEGQLLQFDLMGATIGEPPFANVEVPQWQMSFMNTDGYGGIGGPGQVTHNMRQILDLCVKFFVAQRSGKLPPDQLDVEWRGDSALGDGGDAYLDLVGGYYTGGDHVKWGFPMAFATTMIAWSGIEFGNAYAEMGMKLDLFKQVKWATDYFIKAHPEKYVFYAQVGLSELDHAEWVRSEYMTMDRPALAIEEGTPGSDVAAETAAALAAAAVLFKDDTDYSNLCLSHAMDLFEFAELYRGEYDENEAFASARQFHPSSEFGDELAWAALWLYYATGNNQYLTRAEDYIAEFGLDLSAPSEFSTDDKTIAVMVYHALLTSDTSAPGVQMIIDFCTNYQTQYNADGFLRMTDWHNFGATSGVAYICLYAANHVVSGQTETDFVNFAKQLVIDVLGAGERSYMVGYGHNPPTRPHHRDSACPIGKDCGWGMFEDKYTPNEFTLEGAIMGGPDATSGFWEDNRKDYTRNEPSLVANALFQATVAGIRERELYDEYPSGISLPTEDFSEFFSSWPFPPGTNVVDYCNDKTCANDGICISDYTNYTFTCDCQDGYFGTRCDTITEPVVDFIRQWGHGGEIKLNLPSERPLGAWQVLLEFPPGCQLQSLDIWHGCMDPYASSLSNSTFYVYQVGWHHDHQNIGIVFEADQSFDQNNYWGGSAACFDETAYSLTLVARGSHASDNIDGMTLQWSTDPDKCPGELPWTPPSTDPAYPENIILGGDEVIDQAFLDLMVNNYDGPGHTSGDLEVEWVSVGEEVGWMRIWLPDAMPPAENPWQLQIAFPEGCNVQTVLTYQACINTVNSDLNNDGNATAVYGDNVANLLLYQNGTDLGTEFIGLRIKFPQADQMSCLDANAYIFSLYEWNDPIDASALLDTCEIMYPDRDTQLALLGDSGAVYVPESTTPSMEFLSGPLSWTQGANGHFFLPNPKPLAPFGLQVQVPSGCNIQRINFWHACVVLANSNINSGYFELEQIGWQEEHGYIGFSVDFQPSQYSSDIPASCKDASLYTLTLDDRSLDPQVGISWNGYYNDYADNCPQALGEALPYSSYEVQLRDGAALTTSLSGQMTSRLGTDPFAGGAGAATTNPGERPIYYSDRVSDGQLTQYQQASIATWAKRYDAEAKEEKMREAERQAAKLAFQIENGLVDARQQQNTMQNRNMFGFNAAGGGGLTSTGMASSSLPSSSIPVKFETRNMDATSAELFWQHPAGKRERYKIEYKPVADPDSPIQLKFGTQLEAKMEIVSGQSNKFQLDDLLPGTRYEANLYSMVGQKESVPQRMLFATIPEDPHNVEAESISANKVKLTWNHSGGNREHYRISFFPHAPNAYPESPALVDGILNEVIIEGLDGNTDYFFVVAAETYNVYSDGAFAQASTGTDWCLLKGTKCGPMGECVNYANMGKCECKKGYTGDGFSCSDVNECLTGKSDCDEHASCTNTIGSHVCTCPNGFIDFNGDGTRCDDVNECDTIRPRCHSLGHCVNYPGTYACECLPGYYGDGTSSCADVDECVQDNPCSDNAICTNTVGSVTCECKKGFEGDGFTCKDINECETGDHNCTPLGGKCWNKPGGYGCMCIDGFKGNGWKCEDINECEKDDVCHERAECFNEPGGYRCKCKTGYRGDGVKLCVDMDECAAGMHKCDSNASCKNYVGTHRCKCKKGFKDLGSAFRGECEDIDECAVKNQCTGKPNIQCINVPGGYRCKCKEGMIGDLRKGCRDQDECIAGTHQCSPYAICTNTLGSHKCACRAGFKGDGLACEDINECATGNHNCNAKGTRCVNKPGSFECQCAPGYSGNPKTGCYDVNECKNGVATCPKDSSCVNILGSYKCNCAPGFEGDGASCNDINECEDGSHTCHASAKCTNTVGSYDCSCPTGFTGDGFSCTDIDECENNEHSCGTNAVCVNFEGGYDCACPAGFTKDGVTCEEPDRCSPNPCPPGAECKNQHGTFVCACPDGFKSRAGVGCVNVDECAEGLAGCHEHAICIDNEGSFQCKCKSGYEGNGRDCSDIDECASSMGSDCDRNAKCKNVIGGHECTCKPGFIGDGLTCEMVDACLAGEHNCRFPKVCIPLKKGGHECACDGGFFAPKNAPDTCVDIDECTMGTHNCNAGEKCENRDGGFTCQCQEGHFRSGGVCRERDECALGLHDCDANASCLNTGKGFKCRCKDGYSGDGKTCEDVDECIVGVMREMITPKKGKTISLRSACPGAECVNTIGSYKCKCKDGFKVSAGKCVDINECDNGSHNCKSVGQKCVNTAGSFKCICAAGYLGSGDQCVKSKCSALRDIPVIDITSCTSTECEMACTEGFRRVSGETSRKCDWRGKWASSSDQLKCDDIDECAEGTAECDLRYGVCRNTRGSYECSCPEGFKGDGKTCIEIDECIEGGHNCDEQAECANTEGGFICTCKEGFFGSGQTCVDDNECRDTTLCSQPNMRCTNTFGSYKCTCEDGFQQNGDSCLPAKSPGICATKNCHPDAFCMGIGNDASCVCNAGFRGNGFYCEDLDECGLEMHECHGNATCVNTPGAYECNCPPEMIGDGFDCQASKACDNASCHVNADCKATSPTTSECTCKDGFWGNGYSCTDRNECLKAENNRCSSLATCQNTVGSYQCTCEEGYEGDGIVCEDADECALGTHNCGEGAFCINRVGSFQCKCKSGFKGDGRTCVDVDECYSLQHDCAAIATCHNFGGGYSCQCPSGYYGDGFECIDINECSTRKHNCSPNAKCTNTPGDFTCECEEGYFGDGINCVKDLCPELGNSTCAENADCVPKDETTIQCSCKDGFKGNGFEKCEDVDECFEDSLLCSDIPKTVCSNTQGSYECVCADGYAKNQKDECVNDVCRHEKCHKNAECKVISGWKKHEAKCECLEGFEGDGENICADINECAFDIHDCHVAAKCSNTPGSYECSCLDSYEGDGKKCFNTAEVRAQRIEEARNEAMQFSSATGSADEDGEEIDPCESSPCFSTQQCSRLSNTEFECICGMYETMTPTGYCVPKAATAPIITQQEQKSPGSFGKPTGPQYQAFLPGRAQSVAPKKPGTSTWSRSFFNSNSPAKPSFQKPTAKPAFVPRTTRQPITTRRPVTTRAPTTQRTTQRTQPATTPLRWMPPMKPIVAVATNRPVTTRPTSRTTMNSWMAAQETTEYDTTTTSYATSTTTIAERGPVAVNECAQGTHKCNVNAVCSDTFQAYTCSCKAGFAGNGFQCSDVNECQVSSPCAADSDCTNTVGAYVCTCKTGFQGNPGACQDENECVNGRHTCESASMCTNTIGSFKCACANGFEDRGNGCEDINECASQACHPDAMCTNLVGSFECACKDGYKGNGMLCMNIDECATGAHTCAASEKCEDTKGSFNCVGVKCPPIGTFDLALLLDTNVDIGDSGLAATKAFAKEMIDSFEVGASSAKVTVAGYSGEKVSPSVFLLDSATSPKPTLLSKVDSINFSGRDLRIERALAFLVNFSFLEAMGRRPDKPGIAILTASKKTYSASALDAVVRRIRTDKTTRYITIGVGEASKTEMASVSGNPQYVFNIDSYDELPSLMPKIMDLICEIDAEYNQ